MMKEVEDVPELMHHIQLRLPIKAAAQTSLLSKSWLHAWSTIPTLRIHVGKEEQGRKRLKMMDLTLKRYHHDNIPLERFDLGIDIENCESASLAANCFRTLATNTFLKELSLILRYHLYGVSFDLPDEILLAGENLTKITVSVSWATDYVFMKSVSLPQSRSLSLLRELHLEGVRVSQQVLDHILSSCSLLASIMLKWCSRDLNVIKVKNLPYLSKLYILTADKGSTALEISNVPNLDSFSCNLNNCGPPPESFVNTHSISLGSSLTRLSLGGLGMITDDASLDIIQSGRLPLLKSLTLNLKWWTLGRFHFTCASINRFSLLCCPDTLIDVQINAPKLLFFCFGGDTMPRLLFPSSITLLKQADFWLDPEMPLDVSFFLKMREALTFTSKCYIRITADVYDQIDIVKDLRERLTLPPATNVEQLSFETSHESCTRHRFSFFDAFFVICRPRHVFAKPNTTFPQNNHFCNLMINKVLSKYPVLRKTRMAYWPRCLKSVEIRLHGNWETLTTSHTSFLENPTSAPVEFKLNWS